MRISLGAHQSLFQNRKWFCSKNSLGTPQSTPISEFQCRLYFSRKIRLLPSYDSAFRNPHITRGRYINVRGGRRNKTVLYSLRFRYSPMAAWVATI